MHSSYVGKQCAYDFGTFSLKKKNLHVSIGYSVLLWCGCFSLVLFRQFKVGTSARYWAELRGMQKLYIKSMVRILDTFHPKGSINQEREG